MIFNKLIKQISAVMRTGCCFRVILHRKCRFIFYANSFNGFIIEIDMGNFYIWLFPHSFRINAKTMILRSDLAFTGNQIFYRVIQSAVTMMHFKSWNIIGQCQQLVTKTNSK